MPYTLEAPDDVQARPRYTLEPPQAAPARYTIEPPLTQQSKPPEVKPARTPTQISAAAKPKSWADVRTLARHPTAPNKDFGELPALWNMAQSFVSAPVGDIAGAVSGARHLSPDAFYQTRDKVIGALSLPEGERAQKLSQTLSWPMERATHAARWVGEHTVGKKATDAIGPLATTLTDMTFARGITRAAIAGTGGLKAFADKEARSRMAPDPVNRDPVDLTPPEGLTEGGVRPTARRVEDELYTNTRNNTADKIEAKQYLEGLPKQWSGPEFQEKVYSEIEARLAKPDAPYSPEVKAFMESPFGKWYGEQADLYTKIKQNPLSKGLPDIADIGPGYVHRVVKGAGTFLDKMQDPEAWGANKDPLIGRGRSLSKNASSLQQRRFFVLEDSTGKRTFVPKDKLQERWEPGQTYRSSDGTDRAVKHATTAEIEANTEFRYHKNALVNTVDNVLRLRRVDRNLQTLEKLKGGLKSAGLMVEGQARAPDGYRPTTLPQFMGARLDPKIADVFDDFHGQGEREGDSLRLLERVNRIAIGSLFWQPFSHIRNVGGHWFVGRGFDWITPQGLKSFAVDGARAVKSVMTQDEHYVDMLRHGAGLQYADRANANFYDVMLKKLTGEQLEDRAGYWKGVAKSLGYTGLRDLVEAEYKASSKMLWAANDMFMMQRYFELMRKGASKVDAIRQAERDIPNYRIPSEVMGSRMMSQVLRNPDLLAFGRYKYGQFKAYSEMLKDLLGPGKDLATRRDALGKAMVLGLMAYGTYEYANPAVQKLTGNSKAAVYPGGPMAPLQGFGEMELGWGPQQRDLASFVSTVVTPSPLIDMVPEITTGRDWSGKDIVNRQSPWYDQVTQGAEAAADKVGPLAVARQAMDPGGAARTMARQIAGVRVPNPASGRGRVFGEKQDRARAKSFQRRDEVGKKVRETLRKIGVIP